MNVIETTTEPTATVNLTKSLRKMYFVVSEKCISLSREVEIITDLASKYF